MLRHRKDRVSGKLPGDVVPPGQLIFFTNVRSTVLKIVLLSGQNRKENFNLEKNLFLILIFIEFLMEATYLTRFYVAYVYWSGYYYRVGYIASFGTW